MLALETAFASLEMNAGSIGMGGIDLRGRHRQQHDAVDRAGRHAQLTAGAVIGDHGMHQLGGADNRVDGTDLDALGAADAVGLDDPRQRARFLDAMRRIQGQRWDDPASRPAPRCRLVRPAGSG